MEGRGGGGGANTDVRALEAAPSARGGASLRDISVSRVQQRLLFGERETRSTATAEGARTRRDAHATLLSRRHNTLFGQHRLYSRHLFVYFLFCLFVSRAAESLVSLNYRYIKNKLKKYTIISSRKKKKAQTIAMFTSDRKCVCVCLCVFLRQCVVAQPVQC